MSKINYGEYQFEKQHFGDNREVSGEKVWRESNPMDNLVHWSTLLVVVA